ncbi:hypothetical protein C1A50_0105 [Paenibacillus polymyxa]|nr:hypothetical protein C1A50_0105 [Paenibacillus polymyxa]
MTCDESEQLHRGQLNHEQKNRPDYAERFSYITFEEMMFVILSSSV